MAQVRIGAHPWVYAATQPEYDIYPIVDQIFEDMAYAGMDGIELMHTALRHDGVVERLTELSKKHSLPVIGTSFGGNMLDAAQAPEAVQDAELIVPRLAALGGTNLGTSVGRAPEPKTPEQFDVQAETLRKIMAVCKDNGVVLNLHNHTYEVENGEHDLNGTLERIPDVKLGPDLGWVTRARIDPVDFIRRHADRLVFLHLRDETDAHTWPEAMGEGDMDYGAIGKALQEAGFSGDAAVELAHERDLELTRPLKDSLKMSREYVRQTLGH